jgi:hypothetical protein
MSAWGPIPHFGALGFAPVCRRSYVLRYVRTAIGGDLKLERSIGSPAASLENAEIVTIP